VRGAVSLAAALAVPAVTDDGSPLAGRDVIVFVTAVVIVVTLLLQGQTMPAVIRWARLAPDPSEEQEELLARRRTVSAALDELAARTATSKVPPEVVERLRGELEEHAAELDGSAEDPARHTEHQLRKELLTAKRAALVSLRNSRMIDDAVLRRVQETLDAEEVRLALRITAAHSLHPAAAPEEGAG